MRPPAPPRPFDPPVQPLDAGAVERIAQAALSLLADPGIQLQSPVACRLLADAGCQTEGGLVRMPADFLREMLARAPRRFTLVPRNPARAISLGTGAVHFGTIASTTHVWDIERGKHLGDKGSFRQLLRMSQQMDCIHFIGGYPVEPADVPTPLRHADSMATMLRLSDKLLHAYPISAQQAEETMELVRLAAGLQPSEFEAAPRLFSIINSVAPLRYEGAALEAAMRYAALGQAVMVTPFPVAGISAPAGLAPVVVLALAEGLAAVALMQLVRPGAPVIFGALTPPAQATAQGAALIYGAAENMRATQMLAQMARHFGLPFRATGGCSAPIPDSQAMWESSQSLQAAMQSHADMVCHAAGWLEGGLTASLEKFLMDCEILDGLIRYCGPEMCASAPGDLGLEAIRAAGPGGQFYDPRSPAGTAPGRLPGRLSERRSYEAWQQDGALWTSERAHRLARQILAEASDPPLSDAAREGFDRYAADLGVAG